MSVKKSQKESQNMLILKESPTFSMAAGRRKTIIANTLTTTPISPIRNVTVIYEANDPWAVSIKTCNLWNKERTPNSLFTSYALSRKISARLFGTMTVMMVAMAVVKLEGGVTSLVFIISLVLMASVVPILPMAGAGFLSSIF